MLLFKVGKSKKPRCFRGVKTLPVKYKANSNPSHTGINNACEVIKRFLEMKPNSDFNSFYKLENQLIDNMVSLKSRLKY